jgi:hypothetical protein
MRSSADQAADLTISLIDLLPTVGADINRRQGRKKIGTGRNPVCGDGPDARRFAIAG